MRKRGNHGKYGEGRAKVLATAEAIAAEGAIPGPTEIARRVGSTRSAVGMHVQKLRAAGLWPWPVAPQGRPRSTPRVADPRTHRPRPKVQPHHRAVFTGPLPVPPPAREVGRPRRKFRIGRTVAEIDAILAPWHAKMSPLAKALLGVP